MKFNPASYLHSIPEQSAKCLMGIQLPLYAAFDSKRKQLITFEWTPLDNSTLQNISGWKVISSLCYLEEMGIYKIRANSLLVIAYNTLFNEGKSIFPLFMKVNNFTILQMDCMIIQQMKGYGGASEKVLGLGLRCRAFPQQVQDVFYSELKHLMGHIKSFFFCLGNSYPIALIINEHEWQQFYQFLENHPGTGISCYNYKQLFRILIFDPDASLN